MAELEDLGHFLLPLVVLEKKRRHNVGMLEKKAEWRTKLIEGTGSREIELHQSQAKSNTRLHVRKLA